MHKDDGHIRSVGKSGSHVPPLLFSAAKNHTFHAEDFMLEFGLCPQRHRATLVVLSPLTGKKKKIEYFLKIYNSFKLFFFFFYKKDLDSCRA